MNPRDQSTTLHTPNQVHTPGGISRSRQLEEKNFTFDKSFWSHNPTDSHYATQEDVYRSFGEEFLSHNFDGFHTCIFAYGQTGSGKSYTMMGNRENPGLIPRTCEALFARIKEEPEPNTTYTVHVSYFEVYNEHVRDLLVPKANAPAYLKIRESPQEGVYVQGLTDAPVRSFSDVERLMRLGDVNRTTAATKMNDTSSRSHAVFTIQLKQIQHSLTQDETIERTARMRLVDLAGSERANKTEATGQRLVEGGKINKSLTTLGRVIAALADPRRQTLGGGNVLGSPGGRNSPRPGTPQMRGAAMRGIRQTPLEVVPYRDSVLTWLLKDSLGGNSKTAMVACISPTDYDETLSTLRYADQAKRIRTRAHANIDAVSAAERDAQIANLQTTISALQASLNLASNRKKDEAIELEDYQKQVMAMQRLMEETKQISEARIRALTAEVEELRPHNLSLQNENESLRRHVTLLASELKNPIIIPEEYMQRPLDLSLDREAIEGDDGQLSPDSDDSTLGFEDEQADSGSSPISSRREAGIIVDEKEQEAMQVHDEAQELLEQLKMFRRKARTDMERFPIVQTAEAY